MFNIENFDIRVKNKDINKIHLIGIGGISMSGIAMVLKKCGYIVTGSDRNYNDMISILEQNDINVYIGTNADLVKDADLVIYTSAINQHDVEFVRAKSLNIPTFERAYFLGVMLRSYKEIICISGTHGKTTTTAMTSAIFIDANLKPNVQIGSKHKKLNDMNYLIGDSEYFILEACEYVDSFLNFPHNTATILNIEEDHLDYFKDINDIKKSFKKFILMIPDNGNLIINQDDSDCMDVLSEIIDELDKKNINKYTFSISEPTATIYAKNIFCNVKGFYSFDITDPKTYKTYNFYLTVPGIHNIYDALAAITTAYAHNIDFSIMQKSLSEFCGAKRRFEFVKELPNHILIYDDYAHHPTEIKATLAAAKQKNKSRVVSIFQPHTYTRTYELLDDFSCSFKDSDLCIITDIYAAREKDEGIVSSEKLVELLLKNNVKAIYIKEFDDIVKYLKENLKDNDIVLTIGAGTITKLSTMIEK
ncbi:MAG: UDP-N-acetylmuramate--L-alanine ligase [Clostridia bacterium]